MKEPGDKEYVSIKVHPMAQPQRPGKVSRLQSYPSQTRCKGQKWRFCVRELGKWRLDSESPGGWGLALPRSG